MSDFADAFQCRTQHDMWCNYIAEMYRRDEKVFQCRTQHDMWCNIKVIASPKNVSIVSMPHAA